MIKKLLILFCFHTFTVQKAIIPRSDFYLMTMVLKGYSVVRNTVTYCNKRLTFRLNYPEQHMVNHIRLHGSIVIRYLNCFSVTGTN